ncbi:MAG: hypothetical protein J6J12_09865 [Oscillospiraceae bacterium]|nr:hypothetical protein [Oscillospiraceae bacterium]
MERISRFRALLFLVLFAFVLVLFAGRLFVLQIIETDGDTDNTQVYGTVTTVRAARGDILDRNGNVLVGNRASYNLVFNHYVIKSYAERNQALYNLVQKCKELGIEYSDHFPVSRTHPFEYTLTNLTTSWQNNFQLFMSDITLDSDVTAPLLVERMRDRYDLPDEWSDEDARAVVGLRYEFDLRGITNLPTYTFLEDVSDQELSALLELNTPGLIVEASTVREYHTKYAAHVLGYLGGMDNDEWAKFKEEGYSMDAKVGKTGFEQAFEGYLHGIDGTRYDEVNREGATTNSYYTKDPIAGNNVETTLDIDIQKVAEDALEQVMLNITNPEYNTEEGEHTGLDAQGAAVIVMEVKTGNILACASYPTYNLATMYDDWAEIMADEKNPMFNRAFGAEYPPGSTFKMCTLISAMEHRNSKGEIIHPYGGTIDDRGVYTAHEGFSPTCLAWSSSGYVHRQPDNSPLNAEYALCYSCNYFFYQLGDLNNWENMEETCKDLGLGVPTGIELTEKPGRINTPDVKKEIYGAGVDSNFSAGDRILGAIGQGENRFTPMQLAVYASTLANKGTRMKATFLSRVVSSDYRELIYENEPIVMGQLDMEPTTIETYYTGMRYVVTKPGGTADRYFGGPDDMLDDEDGVWPLKGEVEVYAKTGTAEHASGGSDHGIFVCFAKRVEDAEPDIAIAIFGEKAAHGSSLAPVAEKILLTYYEMEASSEYTAFENQAG